MQRNIGEEKKNSTLQLSDFHYGIVLLDVLYIPQTRVGLKTSGLVTLCLARMKVNI